MTTSTRHRTPNALRAAYARINWSALLGVVLLVACAYIVAAQYNAGLAAERRGECQAHVNEELVHALQVRDQVNQRIRTAQRELVGRLVESAQSVNPDDLREVNRRYLEALQGADHTRAAYPIPAVIRC